MICSYATGQKVTTDPDHLGGNPRPRGDQTNECTPSADSDGDHTMPGGIAWSLGQTPPSEDAPSAAAVVDSDLLRCAGHLRAGDPGEIRYGPRRAPALCRRPCQGAAKVSPRTQTPLLPSVFVGVLSIAVLLPNLGSSSVLTSVTSVSVVIVYLAYLLVTVLLLIKCFRGLAPTTDPGHWSLGRWGLPANIVAVTFGAFLMIDAGWPRAAVYDFAGGHWYLQYLAPLFIAFALIIGLVAYQNDATPTMPSFGRARQPPKQGRQDSRHLVT